MSFLDRLKRLWYWRKRRQLWKQYLSAGDYHDWDACDEIVYELEKYGGT